MNKERMLQNLLELCHIPSISESSGEIEMVHKLDEMLRRIDYFEHNPANIVIKPIPGDHLKRSIIYALMEGKNTTSSTIILLSHLDVVGVDEFGAFKDLAFSPLEYTEFLKNNRHIQLSPDAEEDLLSGDYLFGRGTMDMKYGISANIELLYQLEGNLGNFPGNILFMSVPDEETNSAGMLAAVSELLKLKKEKNLSYTCCLITEPHLVKHPKDEIKYMYTGSVGKLLPLFYCVGMETHVCEPFAGINPNLFTAKIIELIEQNAELSDQLNGIFVPEPCCLKHADTKEEYTVQIPTAAYAYFNYMTLTSTPSEVLEKMRQIASQAFAEVLSGIKAKALKQRLLTSTMPFVPEVSPMILTYQELYAMCVKVHGEQLEEHMRNYINALDIEDLRLMSLEAVKELHKFSPYRNPMIIIMFAPPYYPHSEARGEDCPITQVCRQIIDKAQKDFGETLAIEPFYPGISDMSYLNLSTGIDLQALKGNFPLWDVKYSVPLEEIAALNIPFINIGPWGKDPHKYTERLCLSYSFDVAPQLIYETVMLLAKL